MTRIEIRPPIFLPIVILMLANGVGWANDSREGLRFQATLQATSVAEIPPPPGGCEVRRGEPPAVALLKVVGAGNTNLYGSVYVEQAHCVFPEKFDRGCFKLTKTPLPPNAAPCSSSKPLLEGRYFGTLFPTFNSTLPNQSNPSPGETWLIQGNVCIVSAGGRAVSDCSQTSKGYEPATGITTLTRGLDGPATIFLDQVIRFKHEH